MSIQHIQSSLREAHAVLTNLLSDQETLASIERAARLLIEVFERRGRVYSCGNGRLNVRCHALRRRANRALPPRSRRTGRGFGPSAQTFGITVNMISPRRLLVRMVGTLRIVAIGGLCSLAQAEATQTAADEPKELALEPEYQSGDFWVYSVRSTTPAGTSALKLQWTLLYQNVDKQWVLSRQEPDTDAPPNTVKAITGVTDTAWSGRDDGAQLNERLLAPMFPLHSGKSWSSEQTMVDGSKSWCRYRAENWETVTIALGSFRALRIEQGCYRTLASPPTSRITKWYSPAVGNVVREEMRILSPIAAENQFELIQFGVSR
jgi:hypothetical protein